MRSVVPGVSNAVTSGRWQLSRFEPPTGGPFPSCRDFKCGAEPGLAPLHTRCFLHAVIYATADIDNAAVVLSDSSSRFRVLSTESRGSEE